MKVSLKTQPTAFIPMNDSSNFGLLKDNRHEEEKFSRVCRFTVNHYYQIGSEWLCERVFYPSPFGFEEIEKEPEHPYTKMREQLIKTGIGLMGERPIPNIHKPVQRIRLESKPRRMRLECKE